MGWKQLWKHFPLPYVVRQAQVRKLQLANVVLLCEAATADVDNFA